MAMILDGRLVSTSIKESLKDRIAQLNKVVKLVTVLVGDDPASKVYVSNKHKVCQEVGIVSENIELPSHISESELIETIDQLNKNPQVHGILVQFPLPKHLSEAKISETISPLKDVDGFHPINMGKLLMGSFSIAPCTPMGIIRILQYYKIPLEGKHAVIVGRSNIVGKPMIPLLLKEHCTVSICHSKTPQLAQITKQADILIVAIGKPEMIQPEMIKPAAVVIDVGINSIPDASKKSGSRLVGDVQFETCKDIASWITPVPGGVGLLTTAILMENCLTLSLSV